MQWRSKRRDDFKWHRWFAWYPVVIRTGHDGCNYVTERVWLETIERRFVLGYFDSVPEYRRLTLPEGKECEA